MILSQMRKAGSWLIRLVWTTSESFLCLTENKYNKMRVPQILLNHLLPHKKKNPYWFSHDIQFLFFYLTWHICCLTHINMFCFLFLHLLIPTLLYRVLAHHTTYTEDKRRFLLDGISQIQLAVTEQEHVVLNAQRLLPSQEEVNIIYQWGDAHTKTLGDVSSLKCSEKHSVFFDPHL